MDKPELSVIIVSYNVWSYLEPCIKSILAQQGITTEIIVIDNNSTDGSVEAIKRTFPTVKLIANSENRGYSGANNQGIESSKGNYILLLNPDTEIRETDTLLKLKQSLDMGNTNGVIAPSLSNSDGSFQLSFWKTPGVKALFLELFYLHRLSRQAKPTKSVFVETASGAALFFKKSLIEKVGLLDENMFWMDDIDFCYRVREAGEKILYCPDISLVHHGGKSSDNYSVVIPNQVISKIKFYKKHGSFLQYTFMEIVSLIFILSRWCVFGVLSISGNDTYNRKRKAYAITLQKYMRYNFTGDNAIISGT